MKEITIFEAWADSVVESKVNSDNRMGTPMTAMADRPLSRQHDIQYKAERSYPELSPEQALARYMADELEQSEKVDAKQNKQISSIDKEVHDVEQDEAQLQAQLARLIDLVQRQN
jgi:septal ring factor EnvC (AmiA/AmiB activator)